MKNFTEYILSISKISVVFMLFFTSAFIQHGFAQCDVLLNTNRPNDTLQLSLNSIGQVTLNHQILISGGVVSSSSNMNTCDTVLIFPDASVSTVTIPGNDSTFMCENLGNYEFFVSIAEKGNINATISPKKRIIVKIVDDIPPILVISPRDTAVNCLFRPNLNGVTPVDTVSYSSFTLTENCSSQVIDTSFVDTDMGATVVGDTCSVIRRVWTVRTQNDGIATDTQYLYIRDTIDPFWDTTAINLVVANDSSRFLPMTDTALVVLIDTSDASGLGRYNFYRNQFIPNAVDSCLGETTPVLASMVSLDTLPSLNGCTDTLRFIFEVQDEKGNLTGSGTGVGHQNNFALSLIILDRTPPEVVEEPLMSFTPLSTGLMDTFLVYVDSGMCSKTFLAEEIDIKVRDAISLDTVAYRWKVDSIGTTTDSIAGSTNTAPLFTAIDTTITRPFGIGDFKVTYFYQDSTCATAPNVDSFQFVLKIRTWEPIVTSRITATTGITEVRTGMGSLDTRVDTIIAFNEAGICGINLDSATVRIIAQDTFEHDTIIYRWRVRTLSGTTIRQDGTMADSLSAPNTLPLEQTFRDTNNAAALFYPVGLHELTYFFRDTSQRGCFNVDSIKYIINVRDTSGNDIAYAPFGTSVVPMNDQFVLTTYADLGECTDQLNFDEPVPTDFTNCGVTTGSVNTTIERKLVSSPNSNIFASIFGPPNGGSIDREFPIGETIFRYIFTDSIGSTDSITFNITVLDTVPPVANCPTSVMISRDPVTCMGVAADYRDFITDNCMANADLSITQTPGIGQSVMDGQTITLLLDGVAACSFTAELTDLAPMPVLPLAQDTTIYCSIIELPAPRATICGQTDTIFALPRNRGQINISTATLRTYIFDSRETTIVWEFFDSSTPEVTRVVQEITFLADTIAPVAVCYDSVTVFPDTFGSVIILPSDLDSLGLSRDNCTAKTDLKMSVSMDTLVNCDSIGKFFEVFLYLEDEAGNRDTCSSIVTVKDTLAPLFSNIPANDTLTCTDAIPAVIQPDIVDNCTGVDTMFMAEMTTRLDTSSTVDLETLQRSFDYFNYEITRTFFAVDKSGNIDSVKQVITVRDITPPSIAFDTILFVPTSEDATRCSGNITLDLLGNVNDQCSDTLKYIAVAGQDSMVVHDTLEIISLNVAMGDTTIYIIAEDWSNNRDTHKIEIRVDDRTDPEPRCNNAIAVTINAFGFAAIDSSVVNLNSIDNCSDSDNLRFELSQDTFRCADIGQTIPIFMTVIDEVGNRASCQSMITVQDFAGTGSFACPSDVTIACDASISPDSTGTPSRMDVCGSNSTLDFSDKIVAGPGGTGNICQIIERSWTLTDNVSGTVTTCLQLINLVDAIAPELDTTYADAIVECFDVVMTVTADSILATDNCVDDVYVHAVDSFTMGTDTILLRRIWTAFDSCRMTADTQFIKIVDDIAPAIDLPSDTFVYNTGDFNQDSCGVFVTIDFEPYVTDCNAQLGLSIGYQVQDSLAQDSTTILSQYFPVGEHSVIIMARDSSNNIGRDTLIIDVNDTSIPTVVCVENIVVSLGTGGMGVLEVSDVFIRATDNCGGNLSDTLASLSQTIFDCNDLGSQEVILMVRDTSGNMGTCTVNVNVVSQGNTDMVSVTTFGQDESITGQNDGVAWVVPTGGSGKFTYQWNDPSMSTNDTISNLAPGLYTVVVNDDTTGCRLTDTIRINEGSVVTYLIGDVSGMPGSIVQVPVTVTNFTNVTSIDMAFNLSNMTGEFIPGNEAGGFNVPGIGLTSFNIDPDNSSSLLVGPNLDPQNGQTVADGTVIFYINVQIPVNATIGSTVDITGGGNSETDIKTGLLINGSPVDLVAQSTSGTITVTNVANDPIFGGKVNLVNGNPLPNVTITLSGDASDIDTTNGTGDYSFTVEMGQSLSVKPSENGLHNQGLFVTDLAIIQNHILGNTLLDSPYKIIAADVNDNQSITVTDLAEIQAVILGARTEFFTAPAWKFIPADFVIDIADPWANPIPDSIATVSDNADFIAVKMGDANLSATSTSPLREKEVATSRDVFRFGIEDLLLKAGEVIEVPFKAKDFEAMYAYQMTLNVDTDWLTFENVKAGALTNITLSNFGLDQVADGLISTLWYVPESLNIEQNTTLFTVSFRVNNGGKYLSDILRASSDKITAAAFATNGVAKNISLIFDKKETIVSGFELFQNRPNPFKAQTTISFNLPKTTPVALRFYDFSGRMVHQIKGDYAAGINEIIVSKSDLSGSGVLYYEIETPNFSARKKMIVLE